MSVSISVEHNEYRLLGTLSHLNLGSGVAKIRIYDGARPSNGAPITGETLLVEIALADPPGAIASNALTLFAVDDSLVVATGTATWARIVNGNGDHNLDCDVSASGGGGEVVLASTTLYAGGVARVLSAVFN